MPQTLRRRPRAVAAVSFLAFGLLLLPVPYVNWRLVAVAGSILLAICVVSVSLPWHRLPVFVQVLPAIAFFPVVGLLREAGGAHTSGFAALSLLPIIWLALYSSQAAVLVALGGVALTFTAPIVIIGEPRYSIAEWLRAIMAVSIASVAGFTVKRLVLRKRELTARLREAAHNDAVTGLPNRHAWDAVLPRELARARRDGAPVSVAIVDLDRFKAYNDRFGHPAGDALLEDCARSWRAQLREVDLLSRYGGEEFAIVLPRCTVQHAFKVMERLRRATPAGQTCSAGVAQWNGLETGDELVARADRALYQAKRRGRNRTAALETVPVGERQRLLVV